MIPPVTASEKGKAHRKGLLLHGSGRCCVELSLQDFLSAAASSLERDTKVGASPIAACADDVRTEGQP